MIAPVYKPLGKSTHLLAKRVGELQAVKATHTGTLDPMAEGVVVVLTGEDRFNKSKYDDWDKVYQFEVLFGVNTDSLDLLGLIKQINKNKINRSKIENILPEFVGPSEQIIPSFSAKRIDGKSFFDKAKQNQSLPKITQKIKVNALDIKSVSQIKASKLLPNIIAKLDKVEGNFRQNQIIESWKNANLPNNLTIVSFEAVVSKRTYIRGIVRDLSQRLQIAATTFSITRTQNGPFGIKDCVCLV